MKKGKRAIALCFIFVFLLSSCYTKEWAGEDAGHSSALDQSSDSQVPSGTETITPVVEDGLATWHFTPPSDLSYLTVGVVVPQDMASMVSNWQTTWAELNTYLAEKQAGYQIELIVKGVLSEKDPALEKKAVQQCLAENIAILTGSFSDSSSLDMEWFVDLGQAPYCQAVAPVLELYPDKYWEYVEKQWGGLYSISNEITWHGNVSFQMLIDHEALDSWGLEWEGVKAIGYTWDEWEQIFTGWQEAMGETAPVLAIDETTLNSFLQYLAPETECQLIAPGVGIHLETGEIEKVLTMPAVQARIQRYQNWMDRGMVEEVPKNAPISAFGRGSGMGAYCIDILAENSPIEVWEYEVAEHKVVYYPANLEALGKRVCFTGVVDQSENRELALEFLQYIGQSKTLRSIMNRLADFFLAPLSIMELNDETAAEENMRLYTAQGESLSYVEAFGQIYEKAVIPSTAGFYFDPGPVREEIEAIWQVYNSSPVKRAAGRGISFNNATFTEDLIQLEKDMEAAGLNEVVEEAQRQLQVWKDEQREEKNEAS